MSKRASVVRDAMSMLCEELPDGARLTLSHSRDAIALLALDIRALLAAESTPPLVWSSEPPKVPGWYWMTSGNGSTPSMYRVLGNNAVQLAKVFPGHRFAGPIPEPAEPEGGER